MLFMIVAWFGFRQLVDPDVTAGSQSDVGWAQNLTSTTISTTSASGGRLAGHPTMST